MFSADNGDYPSMKTVDGNGDTVTLTYPDGMISWFSQFTSDFDGAKGEGTGNLNVEDSAPLFSFDTIINAIKAIFKMFSDLLNNLLAFMK